MFAMISVRFYFGLN